MNPTRSFALFALFALLSVSSCHLYFEPDQESDAAVVPPADAGTPGQCELSVTAAQDRLRGCLELEQWEARGLCNVPLMNTMAGTCAFCHGGGADGIQLNADCMLTFTGMSLPENFEDLQLPITSAEGCVTGFAPGKICASAMISETHPPFVCPNDIRRSLQGLLDDAWARIVTGECR